MAPASGSTAAPWQMQVSGTTAGLRGIDSVDGTVAWASGTGGTVLRTVDGGAHWTKCAVPDAATDGATLDFRGVQAWDAQTAIVMASGPGEKSRLYKTTDGCGTWRLLLKNSDSEGFYDSFHFWDQKHGFLLGDPVQKTLCFKEANPLEYIANEKLGYSECALKHKRFLTIATLDGGTNWAYWGSDRGYFTEDAAANGAAFAASNSAAFVPMQIEDDCSSVPDNGTMRVWIGLGGKGGARILIGMRDLLDYCPPTPEDRASLYIRYSWPRPRTVPIASGSDSSGIFSVAFRYQVIKFGSPILKILPSMADTHGYIHGVAVGGDYVKPNESYRTAAWSADSGWTWTASTKPPHGYRSAVQWSESLKLWITVGTNGSDVSRDDGKTWQLLDDGNWNALSLPFVVGPQGRIARLDVSALKSGTH